MDEFKFARAAQIPLDRAQRVWPALAPAWDRWSIANTLRRAAYIANARHETVGFTAYREWLSYPSAESIVATFGRRFLTDDERAAIDAAGTVEHAELKATFRPLQLERAAKFVRAPMALGNYVYANREGNGNEASGDGYRHRGGGHMHITFLNGYVRAGTAIGVPLGSNPGLIEQEEHAAMSGAWWWYAHGCNELADRGSIDRIRRVVNGPAMLGRAECAQYFHHALPILEGAM